MLVVFVDLNSLSVSLTDASRLSSIVVLDSESAFVSPWLFWLTNENLYWLSPDNQKPKRQTAMRSRLSTVANFTHITARPKEMKWNDNNCSATYENVLSLIGFFSFLVFGLWKRHRPQKRKTDKMQRSPADWCQPNISSPAFSQAQRKKLFFSLASKLNKNTLLHLNFAHIPCLTRANLPN